MYKKLCILLAFIILAPSICLSTDIVYDGNGRWDTTFDCVPWTGPQSSGDICDEVIRWGNSGIVTDTYWDEINTNANYDGTGTTGGNGCRQYILGDGIPVTNSSSTIGKAIQLGSRTELWLRMYVRYEAGFTLDSGSIGGNKLLYFKNAAGSNHLTFQVGVNSGHVFGWGYQTGGNFSSATFEDYWGNPSDGSWHVFEVHIKAETVLEAPWDGVVEVWMDGDVIFNDHAANTRILSLSEPIGMVQLQSNWGPTPNFGVKSCDVDEIVIYKDEPPNLCDDGAGGFTPCIGPIGAEPVAPTTAVVKRATLKRAIIK